MPHVAMKDMIRQAIVDLKDRNGSSRQALKKYIQANNTTSGQFDSQFNRALRLGAEKGDFVQPKGISPNIFPILEHTLSYIDRRLSLLRVSQDKRAQSSYMGFRKHQASHANRLQAHRDP